MSHIIYNKEDKKKLEVFTRSPWKYMEIDDKIKITKEEKKKKAAGYSMTASDHGKNGKRYSNVIQPNGDTHFIRRS
jgi:hypothetical protein